MYKLTNISGENPRYHGSSRRRVKVNKGIRTVRNGQSIVLDEKDLLNYRFQAEITKDSNPETWTRYHILLAERIIPAKKSVISQTPEDTDLTDTKKPKTVKPVDKTSKKTIEKVEDPKVDEILEETIEKVEDIDELKEASDVDELKDIPVVEKVDEIEVTEKPESSAEVVKESIEPQKKSEGDEGAYTVNQLVKMGKGGILKIKLSNKIKIPGYNGMTVRQKAEKVIEGLNI